MSNEEITYKQYQEAKRIIKFYERQQYEKSSTVKSEWYGVTKNTYIFNGLNISTRLMNGLAYQLSALEDEKAEKGRRLRILKIKDLKNVSKRHLMESRYIGKKTMSELEDLCDYCGVEMKP
jgi:hypothetical protein